IPLAAVLLVAAAAPLPGQEQDTGMRIAYVNSQAVIQQAPGADSAQKAFQQEVQQYRKKAKKLTAELDSLRQQFQQQQGMLSEQARQKRQQELLQRQKQVQSRVSKIEQKLQQRQQELMQPILNRVQKVIEQIRAERGYDMIFDVSGPGVVAADPSLDITQDVIARLKKMAAQRGGGAGPTGAGGSGGR
ncbi:MAG: OmpH family outer membrane protein, partial [Gemmatimonadota bacterium]